MRRVLLFSTLLLFSQVSRGQLPDYHLQVFDYSLGIRPGNYVAISRDNQGFVWVLYPRSIQRFDGKRITEFPLNGSFQYLHTDPEGRVWVTSADQVLRYRNDEQGFTIVPVDNTDTTTTNLTVFSTSTGETYLFSSSGLHRLHEQSDRFLQPQKLQHDFPRNATDIFAQGGEQIFFRAGNFYYRFHTRNGTLSRRPAKNGFRVHALSDHTIFVSTWENDSWLVDFNRDTTLPLQLPDRYRQTSGNTLSIRSMVQISPGDYLVAAREGIFQYRADGGIFTKLRFFQSGQPVVTNDFCQQLFLDRERNVWMLTVSGIARYSPDYPSLGLIRIPQPDNLPQGSINNVRQIAEDSSGTFWFATGNGFVRWEKPTGKWTHYAAVSGATDRLAHPSIRGIAIDGSALVLGPTNFGPWIFDPITGKYHRPSYAHDSVERISNRDFIDDILALKRGDFLLMGRDALYHLTGKTHLLSIIAVRASQANSNRAFERSDGIIWVATQKGLYLLDAQYRDIAHWQPEGKDHAIWTGYLKPDGSLLFPTTTGIFEAQWKDGHLKVQKRSPLFDGSFSNAIMEDRQGVIWASSEKGIYRFDPATSELNLLDYADNIQGYGFNGNGPFRNRDGLVFWSGMNGINYIHPESFHPRATALHVYIQTVRAGNSDSLLISKDQQATLPYDNRSLEIELAAPYFNNPDKVIYRYRIDGLDKAWKMLGNNNRLRLSEIPPGSYSLMVEATVDKVHWVAPEKPFAFRVQKPFWLHPVFLLTSAIVLGVLLWLLLRYRSLKEAWKRQEEKAMANIKQKIVDAEMQALRAQMNPHFIFNSLNSINRYIVKSDQATASLYLTRFARLIRLILDNSNNRTVSLSQELEALGLYIQMESLRFDQQFSWDIRVDKGIQADNIQVPPLIIQPYVENAIWHGLLHKETAGTLLVQVCCATDTVLEVIVEDNGIGRKAAAQWQGKSARGNKSLGMKLTEERLRLLRSHLSFNATITVHDLEDEHGASKGTRVILQIPLDPELNHSDKTEDL